MMRERHVAPVDTAALEAMSGCAADEPDDRLHLKTAWTGAGPTTRPRRHPDDLHGRGAAARHWPHLAHRAGRDVSEAARNIAFGLVCLAGCLWIARRVANRPSASRPKWVQSIVDDFAGTSLPRVARDLGEIEAFAERVTS
jgi:hypothetical protein